MTITTKDLLKFFPIEPSFKAELLEQFDSLDDDRKGEIVDTLWHGFDIYYNSLLSKNVEEMRKSLANGEEQPTQEIFKKAVTKTRKEIEMAFINKTESVDLSEARTAMEKIVKEIRAAKLDKKAATAAKKAN